MSHISLLNEDQTALPPVSSPDGWSMGWIDQPQIGMMIDASEIIQINQR